MASNQLFTALLDHIQHGEFSALLYSLYILFSLLLWFQELSLPSGWIAQDILGRQFPLAIPYHSMDPLLCSSQCAVGSAIRILLYLLYRILILLLQDHKKMSEQRLFVCMVFVDQGQIASLRKHVDSSAGSC